MQPVFHLYGNFLKMNAVMNLVPYNQKMEYQVNGTFLQVEA